MVKGQRRQWGCMMVRYITTKSQGIHSSDRFLESQPFVRVGLFLEGDLIGYENAILSLLD